MQRSEVSVADRLEIVELLARINQAFDDGDLDGFVACFEPGGVMSGGRHAEGYEELKKWVTDSTQRPPHRHFTTNSVVTGEPGDPDRVTVRSCFFYMEQLGATMVVKSTGLYEDTVVRRGGRWRMKYRRTVGDKTG